jgi:hypothetical protein
VVVILHWLGELAPLLRFMKDPAVAASVESLIRTGVTERHVEIDQEATLLPYYEILHPFANRSMRVMAL